MAFNLKSISLPKFKMPQMPKWNLWKRFKAYPWSSLPRRILRRILATILSLLFLAISLLFLGYAGIHMVTNTLGVEGTVADMTTLPDTQLPKTPIGKYRLVYEGAGLFKGAVDVNGKEYDGIYYLYPAWPNYTEPSYGEAVRVWPAQHPRVAAVEMKGKGWIVATFFLIIGLVMFEFFLIGWTVH